MTKLKKSHVKDINIFLKEKGLFNVINTYLNENNLSDFEVESVKIKAKTHSDPADDNSDLVCKEGFQKVEVCTTSGKCEWKCLPI